MYNLFVKGNEDPYENDHCVFDIDRCLRVSEYTTDAIANHYGTFSPEAITQLIGMPAILTHEIGNNIPPSFARITGVECRRTAGEVEIFYSKIGVTPDVSVQDFMAMNGRLDIGKGEMYRTHWALKDVNLETALQRHGFELAPIEIFREPINIRTHRFSISLSFPGAVRDRIERITPFLEREFGPNSYFYDRNYTALLAQRNHDLLLQDIYRDRSELAIVFAGAEYAGRVWCGLEWDAIRASLLGRETPEHVMFIKTDDGELPGMNPQDGYIDWRNYTDEEIAGMIIERYRANNLPDPQQELRNAEERRRNKMHKEADEWMASGGEG